MSPHEFREGMRKVCYNGEHGVGTNFILKWWRYQYIMKDRETQLIVSRELNEDLMAIGFPEPLR